MRIGLVVVLLTILALMSGPVPQVSAANTVAVLQLNLCHSGEVDCFTGDRVIARAVAVITASRPQVLSVNEACAGDVEPLRTAMGAARAMFAPARRRDGTPYTCLNGQEFGNMIMVAETLAGGAGFGGRFTAQDSSSEQRVWACLPAGALTACTTHLSARDGGIALTQCRELLDRVAGRAASAPVVVAGDLNLRHRGRPNAQDCTPSGFYRKGDGGVQHVFASTGLAFAASTTIDMASTTDHPALLVSLTLP